MLSPLPPLLPLRLGRLTNAGSDVPHEEEEETAVPD